MWEEEDEGGFNFGEVRAALGEVTAFTVRACALHPSSMDPRCQHNHHLHQHHHLHHHLHRGATFYERDDNHGGNNTIGATHNMTAIGKLSE